jgi:UDP-N-acetylmuramoyl-tripeptide--D-alanyl-D-alanine ligase
VRDWDARRLAAAAGAELLAEPAPAGEGRGAAGVSIDSRALAPGQLFVGLRGERHDGGAHATRALAAGAWGVLVGPEHADAASSAAASSGAAVLAHPDPLAALQALAREWRRELRSRGTRVVAITGSTGKTSTKDILAALLAAHRRTAATPANLNTEIGLPLAILAAPGDSECLVLEMAMRGPGQIAELTAIAEPDVGVVVNVGAAHLELLGSLEAIAAAKAELIAGMAPGSSVVVPGGEPLLAAHLRDDLRTITFGEGAEVELAGRLPDGRVLISAGGETIELAPSFEQAHNLRNLLAAVAAATALGLSPHGRLDVRFSASRGERVRLAGGVVVVDDCYNANPMSMRAAIDDLTETAPARAVAVLGDMLELGEQAQRLHREIGAHAAERGVGMLLAVGPLAAAMAAAFTGEVHSARDAAAAAELLPRLLRHGDTVLVKGSRGVGLERVVASLAAAGGGGGQRVGEQGSDGPWLLDAGAGPGRR